MRRKTRFGGANRLLIDGNGTPVEGNGRLAARLRFLQDDIVQDLILFVLNFSEKIRR